MSRRDDELVAVAQFATRLEAEQAWTSLVAAGVPSTVVTNDPPWGEPQHFIQCARKDAESALEVLTTAAN